MKKLKTVNERVLSVAGLSLFSAYILSFLFEGRILYGLCESHHLESSSYILVTIAAHLLGLLSGGYFEKSSLTTKNTMLGSMVVCLVATTPFFFKPSILWIAGLLISGYASGLALASWGYFLKTFTASNQRLKSCADVLIYSNLGMIAITVTSENLSPLIALTFSMFCIVFGIVLIWALPTNANSLKPEKIRATQHNKINKPLLFLSLFVFVITINSGLMYQVINPAFQHLSKVVAWYWALPYVFALITVRTLFLKKGHPKILYIGMSMILAAFIGFLILGRSIIHYLIVNTLLLGALGIFDLFWWSILGEMLDYSTNPARVFGFGLAANVLGILVGDTLGITVNFIKLSPAEITVIAFTITSITLMLLPSLNRELVMLLKSHVYLTSYAYSIEEQQTAALNQVETLDPLTAREEEVLKLILDGKSNREIAEILFISENTVKTHIRNIFSKYDVNSRAKLISTLLKDA